MTTEIKVPDIGDFDAVEVIEILVAVGDSITEEQSLVTVESDKASMEIPSTGAGVVKSLNIKIGDKIHEGSVILEIEPAESEAVKQPDPDQSVSTAAETSAAPVKTPVAQVPADTAKGAKIEKPVLVPDIGDFDSVEIIEILVSIGDSVESEQSLITVESDKASMEIPSTDSGVVKALKVKVGDHVSQGSEILIIETTTDSTSSQPVSKPAEIPITEQDIEGHLTAKPVEKPAASTPVIDSDSAGLAKRTSPTASFAEAEVPLRNLPHASPSVRKFARELGANLANITGTGLKNRITIDDVRSYVKHALAGGGATAISTALPAGEGFNVLAWPKVDFSKFGVIETKPLSRIKKISGANLHRNWVMIPHVTNNDVADITGLEALRKQLNEENKKANIKITMLAFLIKAVVAALKKYPEFNASLDGDNLILKQYYHIGFAADTPNGLVVPVIRDADKKGVLEIAQETSSLAASARDGKLSPAQMQGGCFSISSLGGIGGTDFTPIINAPEVAILGVSRSSMQPVWNGKEFTPKLMLPLSLSYDHRVIDGASAARFNSYLASLLADFRRIIL